MKLQVHLSLGTLCACLIVTPLAAKELTYEQKVDARIREIVVSCGKTLLEEIKKAEGAGFTVEFKLVGPDHTIRSVTRSEYLEAETTRCASERMAQDPLLKDYAIRDPRAL